MRIRSLTAATKIGFLVLFAQSLAAQAAEVKVLAGRALSPVIAELGPEFDWPQGGHPVGLDTRIEAANGGRGDLALDKIVHVMFQATPCAGGTAECNLWPPSSMLT